MKVLRAMKQKKRCASRAPLRERFESGYLGEPNSGCWIWDGALLSNNGGLPRGGIKINGKKRSAHRVAYELLVGPIPPGSLICHKCDVSLCVNPKHLYVGTHATNMRDMAERNRSAIGMRNGFSKLNDHQVIEIRGAAGSSLDIGNRYGVSTSTVNLIKSRKRWTHIG